MPAAHPIALRKRVVESYLAKEGTLREVAERFQVGEASVNRWVNRFRREGTLVAGKRGKTGPILIDAAGEAFIAETVEDIPDITLRELVECYQEEFGVKVSLTTMTRTVVERLGFTKKKPHSGHPTSAGPMSWQREKPS